MKTLKLKNLLLLLFVAQMTLSCLTIQQPLPGSLWGNWTFIKTGTISNGSNQRLYDYRNACYRESDRLHFSSDNKMTLRWYDDRCGFHYQLIGRYHVENNTLKIDLEDKSSFQGSPFPPITEYRIIQINSTTLTLEEIPDDYNLDQTIPGNEMLVFVFMKMD